MSDRLATAQWEDQARVAQRYPFADGKFWLGRAENDAAIGYRDDRHICLVSGTRGGKGTSVIINNLCFWPGSAVVVDPKGENATVTAARRGQGSEHCQGMGQAVHVLDPFKTAQVDERYLSCFNPLDALDPNREESIDEASRLANAIVVVKDDSHEPFWDEAARTMLRGLILHVLTAPQFTGLRNLITVRDLIQRGAWQIAEAIRETGQEQIDPPHLLLWRSMELNPAFDGIVAGTGSRFRSMMVSSPKTFEGVLQAVANHTEFLDSPGMRRVLAKSDFKLSELKTRPEGITLYLSLPQRYMDTHYRWLRMMVGLTTTEMEKTRGQPASGHPVLMVLDEFAGLKRMAAIETAVAQLAGFGVKLLFVLQSLEQLKGTYKDHWETFLSNAGVKIFFSIDDHFTRDYISKLAGETEIIRHLRSENQSQSKNEGYSEGTSQSQGFSQSTTKGTSDSQTVGTNQSTGWSHGTSSGVSYQKFKFLFFPEYFDNVHYSEGGNSSTSGSRGSSRSDTRGESASETVGVSETTGTSQTRTHGSSTTAGTGRTESVHRRPLIQPDEVGRIFARIDDRKNPLYPGMALVMVTGADPLYVQRSNYFEDMQFIDCFSPHPDHKFLPAVPYVVDGIRPFIIILEAAMGGHRLTIAKWLIQAGDLIARPNGPAAEIARVPPDNRIVHILTPCAGKVTATAATPENAIVSGDYAIPDGPLFTVKTYDDGQNSAIDPFQELREACLALENSKQPKQAVTVAAPRGGAPALPKFALVEPSILHKSVVAVLAAFVIVVIIVFLSNSSNNSNTGGDTHSVAQPAPPTKTVKILRHSLPNTKLRRGRAGDSSGQTEPRVLWIPPPGPPKGNEQSPPPSGAEQVAPPGAGSDTNDQSREIASILSQAQQASYRGPGIHKEFQLYEKAAQLGSQKGITMACFGYAMDALSVNAAAPSNDGKYYEIDALSGDASAPSNALKWCGKAAQIGDARSMFQLATLYEIHFKDIPQAITWYRAAEAAGDPDTAKSARQCLQQLGVQ